MTTLTANWMDGAPYEGHYERTSPIDNPATGEVVGEVVHATEQDVEAIIASAKKASLAWAEVSLARRSAILFRFRELLVEHTDAIAEIVVREHGKVFSDAKGEVGRGLEVAEFACSIPSLLKGEYSDQAATGIDVYSFRQPLGVVAGITPFNFPVMIPLWMSPVAIATGNAFILKPPTRDPGAGMFLAELWKRAGLPDGVFNVVHGDRSVIGRLLTHPDVDAISFVGSTTTAKIIYETGTKHGKRVQALGAAKNHGLVLADADLEHAANNLIAAAYGAAGERCMALPVAVVAEEVADELVARLLEKAKAVKVAEGMTPDADMGAIITKDAVARISGLIASAAEEGAEILLDGRGFAPEGYEGGNWLGPTLIDKVRPGMRVNREELFGPTLEIIRVKGLEDGLELINAHEFGNGAAIFTSSGEAARTYTRGVKAGMVGVNVPIPVPVAWHSFGGWKESLVGESHIYGPEGVKFYTRGKVVTQRWPHRESSGPVSFHFSGDAAK